MIARTAELPFATALVRTGIAGLITFISVEDRMSRALSRVGRWVMRTLPAALGVSGRAQEPCKARRACRQGAVPTRVARYGHRDAESMHRAGGRDFSQERGDRAEGGRSQTQSDRILTLLRRSHYS